MIYLNNAATSFPKPQAVIDAVNSCLMSPPFHSGRTGFEREKDDIVYLCRENLAKLFNFDDPLRVLFTSGSTEALNLALKGIKLEGSHVVTTEIEHNSVIRPLKTMELNGIIELTFVKCDENAYVEPENIEKAIRPNTKAIVVNHCSNVTGTILDVQKIAEIAHKHNCLIIVDASQSAGNVPIDFKNWGLDMLAFTGHKSLWGMSGIGGLLVRDGIELEPLKVGGTGTYSEILTQPKGFPIYYEAGTPNTPGIVSLQAGVEHLLSIGLDEIRTHKKKLFEIILNELDGYPGITHYNHTDKTSYANFCFNVENMVPEEVGYILESSYEIMVRTGLHCAPLLLGALGVHPWGTVRASASYFTKENEVLEFIEAIKVVSKMVKRK